MHPCRFLLSTLLVVASSSPGLRTANDRVCRYNPGVPATLDTALDVPTANSLCDVTNPESSYSQGE